MGAFFAQQKHLKELIAAYAEHEKNSRILTALLKKADAEILAHYNQKIDTHYSEEASDDDLRKAYDIFDAAIARLGQDYEIILPMIAQFWTALLPINRAFRRTSLPELRIVVNTTRDLVNAIISACEATRDLTIALKVMQMRIETELSGKGRPAESVRDVDNFLADCWS